MLQSLLNFRVRQMLCIALAVAPGFATNRLHAQGEPSAPTIDRQSPINIVEPVAIDKSAPRFGNTSQLDERRTFEYKNTTGSKWCSDGSCSGIVDQRWGSLKFAPVSAAGIEFGNARYSLLEFHFHSPAEHLVNGKLTEMEVHFVFQRVGAPDCSAGLLLVIGQRIMEGKKNEELEKIFGPGVTLPPRYFSPPYPRIENFIIGNLLGDLHDQSSFRYAGSLTAPALLKGCGNPPGNPDQQLASGKLPQVVSWVLLERPIEMSKEQIIRYRNLFPNGDARGPQELNQVVTKAVPDK